MLPPQGSKFIQLGRLGDILNILPILKMIGGGSVICRPEYAHILAATSYAKHIPWCGGVDDVRGARQAHPDALVTQRFGNEGPYPQLSASFAYDEWLAVGAPLDKFGTLDLDNITGKRPFANFDRFCANEAYVVVVTQGTSGPYPHAEKLKAHLLKRFGHRVDFIIDPSYEKFDWMVELIDCAWAIVTIDTAPLHLTPMTDTPVIYLRPRGWTGSPPKGNCVHEQWYDDTDYTKIDNALLKIIGPEVWFAIPTANPEKCGETFAKWREMGYKTAALVDGKNTSVPNADKIIWLEKYPGYAASVNMLCRELPTADIVVTGGDDVYPDASRDAASIGKDFIRHFNGTYGVMQPFPEGDGIAGGEAGSAVSPWMGREWIKRAYMGSGPMCAEYHHYYVDTELREVAKATGVYWENHDVQQRHDHWESKLRDASHHTRIAMRPKHLDHAFANMQRDFDRYNQRRLAGFPGFSKPVAVESETPHKVVIAGHVFWRSGSFLCPDYLNHGDAKAFIEHVAKKYCVGRGIDVGASDWPLAGSTPIRNDPHCNAYKLDQFADGSLDYAFSSHCIEHLDRPCEAVALWARKVKRGGVVFIYAPHPDMLFWRPGGVWVGNGHLWSPTYDALRDMLVKSGCVVEAGFAGPDSYWSMWVAGRKA